MASLGSSPLIRDPLPPDEFGQRLRLLLERRGLSVREGASRLEVSTATLQKWRDGKDGPRYRDLRALAELLGENPARDATAAIPVSSASSPLLSRGEVGELLDSFAALEASVVALTGSGSALRRATRELSRRLEPLR